MSIAQGSVVAPTAPDIRVAPQRSRLAPIYNVCKSHGGQYSVERMLAFEEYCRRTPLLRAVAVCVLTPVPTLMLVILVECLPLRPPSDGPTANYAFWVRHLILVTIIMVAVGFQAKSWILGIPLTPQRVLGIALCSSTISTLGDLAVARLWTFPVPFCAVLGTPVRAVVLICVYVSVVGRKSLASIENSGLQLQRFLRLLCAQGSAIVIYPAYHAVFLAVSTTIRRLSLVFLPIMDLVVKKVIIANGLHLEDRLPEVVVFTVEVSDGLYTVLCMQSVNSFVIVAALILVLNIQVAMAYRTMKGTTHTIRTYLLENPDSTTTSAVSAAVHFVETPTLLDPSGLRQIRIFSGAKYNISSAKERLLHKLAACAVNTKREITRTKSKRLLLRRALMNVVRATKTTWPCNECSMSSHSTIFPEPTPPSVNHLTRNDTSALLKPASIPTQADHEVHQRNTQVVKRTLELLFQNEYIGLIAYIQSIIPCIYMAYMAVLQKLPNRIFYPRDRSIGDGEFFAVISILAMLQLMSLLVLHWIVGKRLSVSTLHQVAFVLETHAEHVHGKLAIWLIYTVSLPLAHYGKHPTYATNVIQTTTDKSGITE